MLLYHDQGLGFSPDWQPAAVVNSSFVVSGGVVLF